MRTIAAARVELAELKGYSAAIPNSMLLSPTLIRESVASSEMENIHTTVEPVLQRALFPAAEQRSADKEVLRGYPLGECAAGRAAVGVARYRGNSAPAAGYD